jgi:uncharacterized protein
MKLKIADDLALPLEAVTQTFGILAKKGAGKTYTAAVLAEEMLKAGQCVAIVDPTGAWWGIRSGFPVAVFGGDHADVPLQEGAGEVVAQAVVENRFSALLDLSLLRKAAVRRFLTPFLETLYRLNREPLHLFVDEADDVAPQQPRGDEAPLLGALEDVVKRGRRKGIGCTLITQRPADLAKQVLTQVEVLTVLRLSHPRDLAAIREWVNVHADPEQAKEMLASLPGLPVGEAWFWSPGWLDLFRRVKVRRRETFDSSATPRPGEAAKRPRSLAEIDLAALGQQIAATLQQAKENDPRELKRRVAELERQLRGRPAPEARVERVEVPYLSSEQTGAVQAALREASLSRAIERPSYEARPTATRQGQSSPRPLPPPPRLAPRPAAESNGKLPKAERLILAALAQHGPCTKAKAAILAGYAVGGGGFGNALSALRTKGHLEGGPDALRATPAGLEALGPYDPLPSGPDLLAHWLGQLGKAEREILQVLADAHPAALTKEQVAERTPSRYAPDGGGFGNALSRLRTLELVSGRGELRASDDLFS